MIQNSMIRLAAAVLATVAMPVVMRDQALPDRALAEGADGPAR